MDSLRKLNLEECQKISLDILLSVHEYCKENNLTYYIMGGTLLGAIRHGGYIPWDDDIDILMPRPDYEFLLNNYKNENYVVYKQIEGRYSYSKIYDKRTIKLEKNTIGDDNPLGVDIDIFVLDGIENNEEKMMSTYKKIDKLQRLLYLANERIFYKKTIKGIVSRIVARIIGGKAIVKRMEKLASAYDYKSSEYVIRMRSSVNGFTGIMKKDDYNPPVLVKFGKYKLYAPRNYDKWLTTYYGDYMTLPPVEKRKAHDSHSYAISN